MVNRQVQSAVKRKCQAATAGEVRVRCSGRQKASATKRWQAPEAGSTNPNAAAVAAASSAKIARHH